MNAEGRSDLPRLLEQARVLPPEERSIFLDDACKGDVELRSAIARHLEHTDRDPDLRRAGIPRLERDEARGGNIPNPDRQSTLDPDRTGSERRMESYREVSDSVTNGTPDSDVPASASSGSLDRDMPHSRDQHGPDFDALTVLSGTHSDRYEVLERLGKGGMGVVYKARDKKLGRLVALKFLPPRLGSDGDARARFLLEARAASALDHPNVCPIYNIEESADDGIFIAMAYCDGETLRDRIARGRLPVHEALDCAAQVAKGLAHAHEKGIIHRDIKTSNLMLTTDGFIKIVDFGVAKLSDADLTKPGTIFGTTLYMSPEQIRGEKVDHRTDLWSLGVVLYELVTGQRPFTGEYYHAVMYSVLNEEPRPPAAHCPDLPLQLTHLINRLLAKLPNKRYQRASDVLNDLAVIQRRWASRSQTGTDGWITHPGAEEVTGTVAAVRPESAQVRADAHRPLRILVVDDEPDFELLIRQKFLRRIKSNEWTFAFAGDGGEAIEILEADPEIGLVLTDLRMPGMDGLTLLKRLGQMDRRLKSVVISAYGDMDNIRAAMNLGAFDFVTKPINLSDLEATIQKSWGELVAEEEAADAQRQLLAVKQELEVARRIQDAMLPSPFAQHDRVDAYAFTARARDVGGDFYDCFLIDDDHVGFFVGDVASRGVSAALFSTMALVFLKASALEGRAPDASLDLLNRLLYPDGFPELSVSIFIGILNLRENELSYCSAGLAAPLVSGGDGAVVPLSVDAQRPVWERRDTSYETQTTSFGPGMKLLVFTDGITEARNSLDHPFTRERLAATTSRFEGSSAAESIREVVREVMDFSADAPLSDDLTVLALRYLEAPATNT